MRITGSRPAANFRACYDAYARDHSLARDAMQAHDRGCYPDTMLTPFFHWLSGRKLEWIRLNPGRALQNRKDHADFEQWLGQRKPGSDLLTCECHVKCIPLR